MMKKLFILSLLVLATAMSVFAGINDPTGFGNATAKTAFIGGTNGTLNTTGNIVAVGDIYSRGSLVCLANGTNCPVTSAGGWTNASGTVTLVNANSNVSAGVLTVDNTNLMTNLISNVTITGTLNTTGKLLVGNPLGTLQRVVLNIGRDNVGAGGTATDIAMEYNSGGYKHFIVTRHNSAINSNGNAVLFYINNATAAGTSTVPGTGNTMVGGFFGGASGGAFGIKTFSPTATLDVNGTATVGDTINPGSLTIKGILNTANGDATLKLQEGANTSGFETRYNGSSNQYIITSDNGGSTRTDRLSIERDTGNIGIGTLTPTQRLSVIGNANITNNLTVFDNTILGNNSANAGTRLTILGFSNTLPLLELGDGAGTVWTRIFRSTTNQMYMENANFGNVDFAFRGNYSFVNSAATSFVLRIDARNEKVGIGAQFPTQKLDVNGSSNISSTLYAYASRISSSLNASIVNSNIHCFTNNTCIQNVSIPSRNYTDDISTNQTYNLTNTGINCYNTQCEFAGVTASHLDTTTPVVTGNTSFTVSAWVYTNSTSASGYTIASRYATSYYNGFALALRGNRADWEVRNVGDGSPFLSSATNLSNTQWYHLVGTYNGTHMVIYVNGTAENTTTYTITNVANSGNIRIGVLNGGAVLWALNGSLRDIRVWSTALNATEVSTLYTTNGSVRPSELVAWWPFLVQNGSERLELDLDTNRNFSIMNGSLGIGTISPRALLDVNGSAAVVGNITTTGGIYFQNTAGSTVQNTLSLQNNKWILVKNSAGTDKGIFILDSSNNVLYGNANTGLYKWYDSSGVTFAMTLDTVTGNLSLGTTVMNQKLNVNGSINVTSHTYIGVMDYYSNGTCGIQNNTLTGGLLTIC